MLVQIGEPHELFAPFGSLGLFGQNTQMSGALKIASRENVA